MTNETLSISDLQDIMLPPAVGIWPPAPLVWLLLALLSVFLLGLTVRWMLLWRRNRYRRAGLELLASIQDKFKHSGQATELVADLSQLLKRVALAAFPREQVASLYGRHWLHFLEGTAGGESCDTDLGNAFAEAEPLNAEQCERLIHFSNHWIRKHKAVRPGDE